MIHSSAVHALHGDLHSVFRLSHSTVPAHPNIVALNACVFVPFAQADEFLFTVPMWNASVPWVLKHLIDTITQPGLVFGFDPAAGYSPLLTGKRAVVVYTSGVYSPGAPIQFGTDFHAEFFNDWLRFIGVTDVSEIRFQPTVVTGDVSAAREAALARARRLGAELADPIRDAA